MNKPQVQVDKVMQELWATKDATASEFGTVSAYISHLRKHGTPQKRIQKTPATRRQNQRLKVAI